MHFPTRRLPADVYFRIAYEPSDLTKIPHGLSQNMLSTKKINSSTPKEVKNDFASFFSFVYRKHLTNPSEIVREIRNAFEELNKSITSFKNKKGEIIDRKKKKCPLFLVTFNMDEQKGFSAILTHLNKKGKPYLDSYNHPLVAEFPLLDKDKNCLPNMAQQVKEAFAELRMECVKKNALFRNINRDRRTADRIRNQNIMKINPARKLGFSFANKEVAEDFIRKTMLWLDAGDLTLLVSRLEEAARKQAKPIKILEIITKNSSKIDAENVCETATKALSADSDEIRAMPKLRLVLQRGDDEPVTLYLKIKHTKINDEVLQKTLNNLFETTPKESVAVQ